MIALLRPQPDARSVGQPEPAALELLMGDLQPLALPDTLDPLVVDCLARLAQQFGDLAIAITAVGLVILRQDVCAHGLRGNHRSTAKFFGGIWVDAFSKPPDKCRDRRKMTTTATRHQQTFGPSPSGSRRLSIARSMAECALAIVADCSAMSLLTIGLRKYEWLVLYGYKGYG